MLIFIGYFVVVAATLGGFILAGGHPAVLLHVSEFVVIGGIGIGVLIVASPKDVMINTIRATTTAIKGTLPGRDDYMDLLKVLYELFLTGKKSGLIALDEHVSEPENSSIFQKYPGFLKNKGPVDWWVIPCPGSGSLQPCSASSTPWPPSRRVRRWWAKGWPRR